MGRQVRWVAGNNKRRATGRREVDVRCLIRLRDKVRVVFVPQTRFDFQAGPELPTILHIELRPARMSVLRALTDAHLCLRWVSQQEVRQGISAIGAIISIDSASVVRKARIKVEMKKIASKPNIVAATMDQDVIVQFEIAIGARRKARRVTYRAERVAQRNLRVAHVRRIRGNTLKAVL